MKDRLEDDYEESMDLLLVVSIVFLFMVGLVAATAVMLVWRMV